MSEKKNRRRVKIFMQYDSGEAKGGGDVENIVTSQNGLLGAGLLKWQRWMAPGSGQMWLAPPPTALVLRSQVGRELKTAPRGYDAVSDRRDAWRHSVGVQVEESSVEENTIHYSVNRHSENRHACVQ